MDPHIEPFAELQQTVNNESDYDIVSLPASDGSDVQTADEDNLMNEKVKEDQMYDQQPMKLAFVDAAHKAAEYLCSPFSQLNVSKKAYEHEQQTVKDKDDTGVDFKAAFLIPDLSHSHQNQDLSNNKYTELDRKMNMYKKEIKQLKDEKKELEQTVSDMGKDTEALRLELIEKIEIAYRADVTVTESKMSKAMEMDAVFCAIQTLKNSENRLTKQMCVEFNKKYGRDWHCFVIREKEFDDDDDFDWYVEEARDNYIDFTVDGHRICLFKTINS